MMVPQPLLRMVHQPLLRMLLLLLLLALLLLPGQAASSPADPMTEAIVEQRVGRLVATMSTEEKARQLDMYSGQDFLTDGAFDAAKAQRVLGGLGIGRVHGVVAQDPALANQLQRAIINSSRFGVPGLFGEEGVHGYQGAGHTMFPSPLSTAASFNGSLARAIGAVIAREARSTGTHEIWSPVCGLAREPRWGRTNEEFGEDVHLAATMVSEQVRGMSNENNLSSNAAVASLLKHFWVYSIGEGGLNTMPAHAGRREVLSEFAEVFRSGIKHGAQGVMSSYNEVDGVPVSADPFALTDTLRNEWNFTGLVTADFGAIRRLVMSHYTAENPKEAVRQYLVAGGNIQGYDFPTPQLGHTGPPPSMTYQRAIIELVEEGALPQAILDARVADVLRVKTRLGLLDTPFVDESLAATISDSPAHQQLAEEAAEQVITLLENRGDTLPLAMSEISSLAVVGPNADTPRCGDYSAVAHSACGANTVNNKNVVSILGGLKSLLLGRAGPKILHVPAVGVFDNGSPDRHGEPYNSMEPILAHHYTNLTATYYRSTNLSGAPWIQRAEPAINHAWFNYGPCGVPFGALGGPEDGCRGVAQPAAATFSVRWVSEIGACCLPSACCALWPVPAARSGSQRHPV